MIGRAAVAAALGLPEETEALPPGDLPLDRLAERFIAYLARGDAAQDAPDAWTGAVMDHLVAEDPALALAVIRAGLTQDGAEVLADPLADLGAAPGMAEVIAAAAADDPALEALVQRANDGGGV